MAFMSCIPRRLLRVSGNEGSRVLNIIGLIKTGIAAFAVWSHSFSLYRGSEPTEPMSRITQADINSGGWGTPFCFVPLAITISVQGSPHG